METVNVLNLRWIFHITSQPITHNGGDLFAAYVFVYSIHQPSSQLYCPWHICMLWAHLYILYIVESSHGNELAHAIIFSQQNVCCCCCCYWEENKKHLLIIYIHILMCARGCGCECVGVQRHLIWTRDAICYCVAYVCVLNACWHQMSVVKSRNRIVLVKLCQRAMRKNSKPKVIIVIMSFPKVTSVWC